MFATAHITRLMEATMLLTISLIPPMVIAFAYTVLYLLHNILDIAKGSEGLFYVVTEGVLLPSALLAFTGYLTVMKYKDNVNWGIMPEVSCATLLVLTGVDYWTSGKGTIFHVTIAWSSFLFISYVTASHVRSKNLVRRRLREIRDSITF